MQRFRQWLPGGGAKNSKTAPPPAPTYQWQNGYAPNYTPANQHHYAPTSGGHKPAIAGQYYVQCYAQTGCPYGRGVDISCRTGARFDQEACRSACQQAGGKSYKLAPMDAAAPLASTLARYAPRCHEISPAAPAASAGRARSYSDYSLSESFEETANYYMNLPTYKDSTGQAMTQLHAQRGRPWRHVDSDDAPAAEDDNAPAEGGGFQPYAFGGEETDADAYADAGAGGEALADDPAALAAAPDIDLTSAGEEAGLAAAAAASDLDRFFHALL
eukprot:tig00021517_g22010.t1